MGFKKLLILLDNPTKSYFPGQNVSGNVEVVTKKESKIQVMTVKFVGRAVVRWMEIVTETTGTGAERKEEKKEIECKDENEYFKCKINLIGNATIPPGHQSYPFSFMLPPRLPSSFIGKAGQVEYMLKLKVKKIKNNKKYERLERFTVNGILDLNVEAGANLEVEQRKHKNICCLCCKSGPIGFILHLPRKGFVPGELLRFKVEMNNQSRKNVIKSKITLVQNVTFHAIGKTLHDSRIIKKVNGPAVDRGESELWEGTELEIPAIPPTRLATCQIIDVQYMLMFEMELSGPAFNLRGELPIIIGTIPFQNTFSEFTQVGHGLQQYEVSEIPGPSNSTNYPPSFIPSAPMLDEYPNMPPPTYAEAMFFEPFNRDGMPTRAGGSTSTPFLNDKFGFSNPGFDGEPGVEAMALQEKPYTPTYVIYERKY